MSTLTLLTMTVVLGVVWGGFLLALITALKKERGKASAWQTPEGEENSAGLSSE